jgi:osomolarity two-component system response regulator SSK1
MDIQMPVMDGIQATKEIRRMEKANAMAGYPPLTSATDGYTPSDSSSADSTASSVTSTDARANSSPYRSSVIIVALTASSLQSDRVAALAAGCNDFLTKPVSLLWLNNKIIEWGSIKALQMWADIRPDAMKSITSGQAAQARNIADRLHVLPRGQKTPSPTRRSSVLEDNAAALALASSAGTILQRLGGNKQFSPPVSTLETPDGPPQGGLL